VLMNACFAGSFVHFYLGIAWMCIVLFGIAPIVYGVARYMIAMRIISITMCIAGAVQQVEHALSHERMFELRELQVSRLLEETERQLNAFATFKMAKADKTGLKNRACFYCGKELRYEEYITANLDNGRTSSQLRDIWQNDTVQLPCCSCLRSINAGLRDPVTGALDPRVTEAVTGALQPCVTDERGQLVDLPPQRDFEYRLYGEDDE